MQTVKITDTEAQNIPLAVDEAPLHNLKVEIFMHTG
jgi:hypothetical protein